ncbi:MAG: chlorohydrolase, partial [Eubacteriales bacterium]
MELIFGNATIITVDAERRIITDGAIAVLGDTIADVGKTAEIKKKYPDAAFYDMAEHIIMPGLINAHVH